ncbi:MAG: hypothetical protein ACRDK3_13145 [Actinomycetota bacterium]
MNNDKYLHIYLTDHLAGSVVGIELARRCAGSNEGSDVAHFLRSEAIPEIEEDRETLKRIIQLVGGSTGSWKLGAAWMGEKLGRLKLNGELTSYSPLSRLVELEGLTSGVAAKLSLWQCLRETRDPRLESIDFDALVARAQQQLEGIEVHRLAAAATALQSS